MLARTARGVMLRILDLRRQYQVHRRRLPKETQDVVAKENQADIKYQVEANDRDHTRDRDRNARHPERMRNADCEERGVEEW
jgi:hypothetical protein